LKIIIAKTAGFCMGVRRAVDMALDAANRDQGPIYTFGPLIHNPQVLELLADKGVSVLESVPAEGYGTVIVRAHGVPPGDRKALDTTGFTVMDATCPRVVKVQRIIGKYAKLGYAAIIIGDPDHPEVVGLQGYAGRESYVAPSMTELSALPIFEKAIIVAQTTQNTTFFQAVKDWAARRHPLYKVFDTICDSTQKRQEETIRLAESVDAVVVVGGRSSGNTQRLAELARQTGAAAFLVETEADLDRKALCRAQRIAITAGASTPNWITQRVSRVLEALSHASVAPEGDLDRAFPKATDGCGVCPGPFEPYQPTPA
jgi:(E)-4-hydroxy-3-methyl-but-2-enyl pyrophosphate reductase